MKEVILLFVGDYSDLENEYIPILKTKVIEYLGGRMIKDNCPDAPILKLSEMLNAKDVSDICQMISNMSGNNLSVLYIKAENDEESSVLSRLFLELKPVV